MTVDEVLTAMSQLVNAGSGQLPLTIVDGDGKLWEIQEISEDDSGPYLSIG